MGSTTTFFLNDDVYTISLPGNSIVLTRYLYLKQQVIVAFIGSILDKNIDDALFWAYELLYSGFKQELIKLLWKIYFDFFYALNPSFEVYFMKKHKTLKNDAEFSIFIADIIQDLIVRPYSVDLFIFRYLFDKIEMEDNILEQPCSLKEQLDTWILLKDYRSICCLCMKTNDTELTKVFENILDAFQIPNKDKQLRDFNAFKKFYKLNLNHVLVARVLRIVYELHNFKKGRSIYMQSDISELFKYLTIEDTKLPFERLDLTQNKYLNLFMVQYNKDALLKIYNTRWLYYAAFSPEWTNRIKNYRGYVDYKKQIVGFIYDDYREEFYEKFQLFDFDEMSTNDKHMFVNDNKTQYSWIQFYQEHKNNSVLNFLDEELNELVNIYI